MLDIRGIGVFIRTRRLEKDLTQVKLAPVLRREASLKPAASALISTALRMIAKPTRRASPRLLPASTRPQCTTGVRRRAFLLSMEQIAPDPRIDQHKDWG